MVRGGVLTRFQIVALGITFAGVAGCATQADLSELRREQHVMQRQLADTRATLDGVQRDVAATRGKVQESRYAERAQSRVENLEARVAALEQGHAPAPPETTVSSEGPPPPPPPPAANVAPPPPSEQARTEVAPP